MPAAPATAWSLRALATQAFLVCLVWCIPGASTEEVFKG